ncbi:MAG TPA: cysteine--tRNA ligase, partial [Deltaproteobacteria bacterium]|nr:cysteine--tRNA ligase [Deltaproteobacteria bacterium]
MPLYLYNTMGKEKQEFVPLRPGHVGLYVCGPTVYDHAHIGHARSAVVFDVLRRYLRFQGLRVSYARNFTDIDDKIVERSSQMGICPEELARMYIDAYREDMETLKVEPPDFEPRVSAYVDHMRALISRLIEKNHAYATKE